MKAKFFMIEELVPKNIVEKYGEKAWWFVDEKVISFLDSLRSNLGRSIVVNNYLWGGKNQYRGFRDIKCKIGAKNSIHRLGKAADFNVKGITSENVRKYILDNIELYPEVRGIELGVSWVHVDFRNSDRLIKFRG